MGIKSLKRQGQRCVWERGEGGKEAEVVGEGRGEKLYKVRSYSVWGLCLCVCMCGLLLKLGLTP